MAVTEEPTSPADTHHDDDEWEEQRENFTLYYKTQNKTLKMSTELMIKNHHFHATQRQWERKIVHWGLQKYTSRQARIEAIESQGRTIAEVAESGRRQQGYLNPNDDRNVRRFARRELDRSKSRSRSRSRSQSFGNRSRSVTPIPGRGRTPSAPDVVVRRENTYNLDVSVLGDGNLPPTAEATPVAIPALPTTQNSQFPQAHVMQTQNTITGETSRNVFVSMPNEPLGQSVAQMDSGLTSAQYGFGDMDQFMSDQMMADDAVSSQNTPFPQFDIDTNIAPDFMPSQQDAMSATSPSYLENMDMSNTWNPTIFSGPAYDPQQAFVQDSNNSTHASFHQTPDEDNSNALSLESSIDSQRDQNGENIPNIVFPSEHSPTFEPSIPNFPPQNIVPIQSKDSSIYGDFYASIGAYTQGMENTIMQFAQAHGVAGPGLTQLSNELHSRRAELVSDLTMHLNSFTSTNQRAVQAMRNDLYILRLRLRGGQPEATPIPGHAHRFSFPEINSNFPYSSAVASNFGGE